jgi:hypothetical protein
MMMLTAFLARVNPDSSMAKPTCMNMTMQAASKVQTTLRLVCIASIASV